MAMGYGGRIGGLAAASFGLCVMSTLAFAQNAVDQRWPADDAPAWSLAYAPQKQIQDPFAGKGLKQPPAGLPAESGVNYSLTPFGGYVNFGSGTHDQSIGGSTATVAFPIGHSFGLLSDFTAASLSNGSFYSGGTNLYWRDPASGMVRADIHGGHFSDLGVSANFVSGGLKTEGYFGQFTPFVSGGAFGVQTLKTAGYASGGVAYYPIDNLRLSLSGFDYGGFVGLSGGVQYLLPKSVASWNGVSTAVSVNGMAGNHGVSGVRGGLVFRFGQPSDKPLIRRDREDDYSDDQNVNGPLVNILRAIAGPSGLTVPQGRTCNDGENPADGCICPPGDIFGPPGNQQCSFPSDIGLKRDIVKLGELVNGIGLYRYRYLDSDQVYVGVMAQEVAAFIPDAVGLMPDGYHLRVIYARLGMRLMTWEEWLAGSSAVAPMPLSAIATPSLNDEVIGAACYRPDANEPMRPSLALKRIDAQTGLKQRSCASAI
jgi:hypothetical protein